MRRSLTNAYSRCYDAPLPKHASPLTWSSSTNLAPRFTRSGISPNGSTQRRFTPNPSKMLQTHWPICSVAGQVAGNEASKKPRGFQEPVACCGCSGSQVLSPRPHQKAGASIKLWAGGWQRRGDERRTTRPSDKKKCCHASALTILTFVCTSYCFAPAPYGERKCKYVISVIFCHSNAKVRII